MRIGGQTQVSEIGRGVWDRLLPLRESDRCHRLAAIVFIACRLLRRFACVGGDGDRGGAHVRRRRENRLDEIVLSIGFEEFAFADLGETSYDPNRWAAMG